jgi:two-component system sensor histidine kinase AlgZ
MSFLLCAFLESFVMYAICHALWRQKIWFLFSLLICTFASGILAILSAAIPLWAESHVSDNPGAFTWESVLSNVPGAAFVLIAWAALYFGVQHYKLSESNSKRAVEAERSARDAQLKALRYQLQPHFLFNTLNAISSLVVIENSRGATEMIARLADLLRSSLDAPDTHFVPLSEEVRVAHEYLAIEQLRFRDRLQVFFVIHPESAEILVPRFLLQPLLENAVRHGISHLSRPGVIHLESSMDDSHLQISVQNDSDLVVAILPRSQSGVGLQNTRTRIDEIYGSEGSVATSLLNDGTFDVTIRVPLTIPKPFGLTA